MIFMINRFFIVLFQKIASILSYPHPPPYNHISIQAENQHIFISNMALPSISEFFTIEAGGCTTFHDGKYMLGLELTAYIPNRRPLISPVLEKSTSAMRPWSVALRL